MLINHLVLFLSIIVIGLVNSHCSTLGLAARVQTIDTVQLPFIKNSANECYFLDEFMPTPDNMVSGRFGKMGLRYYTYKSANYKDWKHQFVILSFYSTDERCWSLFEEYYMID